MNNKKPSYEQYIENGLKNTSLNKNPKYCTEEEFFKDCDKFIENWENELKFKKCIS